MLLLMCLTSRMSNGQDLASSQADMDVLDQAQRLRAASWKHDECGEDSEEETFPNPSTCFEESIEAFRSRRAEKHKLLETHVTTPLKDSQRTPQLDHLPPGITFEVPALRLPVSSADRLQWKADALRHLSESGLLLLRDVVPKSNCTEALRYAMSSAGTPGEAAFEYVHDPKHRHHLRVMPEEPALAPALTSVLKVVGEVLMDQLERQEKLIELAMFLSNPGAEAQEMHEDAPFEKVAPSYSVFLFLTDVRDASDGPLEVVPRSHSDSTVRSHIKEFMELQRITREGWVVADEMMEPVEDVKSHKIEQQLLASAGDVVVYDGSLFHRGSAVTGKHTRGVLYMTFVGSGPLDKKHSAAIRNELLKPPDGPLSIPSLTERVVNGRRFDHQDL